MPRHVTYVGKHSKDKSVSIYLPKRVFVDEGEGVEPISGIVRIAPEKVESLSPERGLFVGVLSKFIYECYDFDVDVVDHTIYERTIQLFPKVFENNVELNGQALALPDEYHFPFTFRLPHGLPPSITLHPGFVYMSRPIGVSYEVFACLGELNDIKTKRTSRAALRFRKASYFPLLKDVKPQKEKEKNFMMGSNRPLVLKVRLDREIYNVGQPIQVSLEISNESKHDVHSIRISAKQVVLARIHGGEKEKYKCQVALLESTRNCPIRKHHAYSESFTIIPKIIESEAYHVAQAGRINLSETPMLAPSTRDDETPKDRKGLSISYYLNVHCCVSMGTDLIVKVPFIMSGNERGDESDESVVRVIPSQELVDQLMSMGYSMLQATRALSRNNNDVSAAIEWIVQHPNALATVERTAEQQRDLLINFEDDVETNIQAEANLIDKAHAYPNIPPPYDDTFGEESLNVGVPVPLTSLVDDVNAAIALTSTTRSDFMTVQAAAAQGLLAAMPYQTNEITHINQNVGNVGLKLADFLATIMVNDSNNLHSPSKDTAMAVRRLANIIKTVASHISNRNTQQELLYITNDILEKSLNLFEIALQYLMSSNNIDLRMRMKKCAQHISGTLPRILEALPGQRDVNYALSTINSALGQLEYSPAPADPKKIPEILQSSLDRLNDQASSLSRIFQNLGCIMHDIQNGAEDSLESLAKIAEGYQSILPPLLFAGQSVLSCVQDPKKQQEILSLVKAAGTTNSQLLLAAKEASINPHDPNAKIRVELCARYVVEAMKQLLSVCNSVSVMDGNKPSSQPNYAQQHMKAQNISRRDSFDDYIRKRIDSQPLNDIDEQNIAMNNALQAEVIRQLNNVNSDLEESTKVLLAARVQLPRPRSIVTSDNERNSITSLTGSSNGTLLDQALSITSAASRLVECAQARQKELLILGKRILSSQSSYKKENEWAEGLVSAAKAVAATISHLVKIAQSVTQGKEELINMIVASHEVNAASTRLLTASRVEDQVNSHTQIDLEEVAKVVTKMTNRLSMHVKKRMDAYENEESEPTSTQKVESNTLTEEKIQEMEHQLRVLKLEEELERERQKLFDLRKKSYKNSDTNGHSVDLN